MLWIVYAMLFVNTINMKIKACIALNAMFIGHCIQSTEVWTLNTKHIHTFLPMTFFIFNQLLIWKCFGKLSIRAFQPYQILCMSTLSIQVMTFYTKYNTFNTMHVDTVDTVEKPWFWAFQNFKQIKNRSNIKEVMSQIVLAMSTLLMQLKRPEDELSKILNGLKISWISRKLWAKNVLAMSTLLIQLKNPDSELSKTFNRLKISWISRKLWAKMYWQCQHCWYSWKPLILSFPKLQTDWKLGQNAPQ